MKKEGNFTETIVRLLLSHSVNIEAAALEQNPAETLQAIEAMIDDLEQIHLAISLAIDPPDCAECSNTLCPSHPDNVVDEALPQHTDEVDYTLN